MRIQLVDSPNNDAGDEGADGADAHPDGIGGAQRQRFHGQGQQPEADGHAGHGDERGDEAGESVRVFQAHGPDDFKQAREHQDDPSHDDSYESRAGMTDAPIAGAPPARWGRPGTGCAACLIARSRGPSRSGKIIEYRLSTAKPGAVVLPSRSGRRRPRLAARTGFCITSRSGSRNQDIFYHATHHAAGQAAPRHRHRSRPALRGVLRHRRGPAGRCRHARVRAHRALQRHQRRALRHLHHQGRPRQRSR